MIMSAKSYSQVTSTFNSDPECDYIWMLLFSGRIASEFWSRVWLCLPAHILRSHWPWILIQIRLYLPAPILIIHWPYILMQTVIMSQSYYSQAPLTLNSDPECDDVWQLLFSGPIDLEFWSRVWWCLTAPILRSHWPWILIQSVIMSASSYSRVPLTLNSDPECDYVCQLLFLRHSWLLIFWSPFWIGALLVVDQTFI